MNTILNYHLREKFPPLDLIEKLFPKQFDRFVDPFCGSANVWTHGSFKESVLSDLNPRYIDVLESVKNDCDGLVKALDEHKAKYGRRHFGMVKANRSEPNQTQRSANWIFLNKCSYQQYFRFNKAEVFLGAYGDHQFCPNLYDLSDLHCIKDKLQNTHLKVSDFESQIDDCREGDFLYLHPPALLESVNYKQDFPLFDYERLSAAVVRAEKNKVKFLILLNKTHSINYMFLKRGKLWQLPSGEHAYYNY